MSKEIPPSFPCKECQAGVLHVRYVTYFTWVDDELVSVPNFPAWVCDICGRREYDQRAIAWLTAMLSPDTGKSPQVARRLHPPKEEKRDPLRPSQMK
jgi:YgiT-type zinc finger domain-containing protein